MGYNNLATLHSELGHHAEAASLFYKALVREPNNFTALEGLGATLAALRKYKEAAAYLGKAWSTHPEDFRAGYEWARVLHELNRPAEAQNVLRQLTPPRDASLTAQFYTLSGAVAEQSGDREGASRFYARAYELTPGAFETYLALVRTSIGEGNSVRLPPVPAPLSAEQHFTLGLAFASSGDYAQAVPEFEQTLQLEPTSYSTTYNLAWAYKQAGKAQLAIKLIERAITLQPKGELYNLLGSLEEEAGHYVDAIRQYQKAVEMEPANEQFYFDLGAEYLIHFTFEPALEVFHVGTQKFPSSARQHIGSGLAYFSLRKYPEAAESLLSALEIDPSSHTTFKAWNALPPFVRLAEWERIRPRLERLARLHPKNPQVLYCYAAALSRYSLASHTEQALTLVQSLLEQALRLKPSFTEAQLELGTLYETRGQYKEAVASFLEAIRLNPDSDTAHYRLAQTYRNLNQLDSAERELARYVELSRTRRDKLAQTRSTITQFILAQPTSSPVSPAPVATEQPPRP
jgi:tetratricopeptide (TPR) repeat protein